MAVLDEKGRLFGVVNVADLVVVLVVVGAVVGGLVLALEPSDSGTDSEPAPTPETNVTNVTLVFSGESPWIIEQFETSGTVETNLDNVTATLNEQHFASDPNGNVRGVFQATIEGRETVSPGQGIRLDGKAVTLSTSVATVDETSLDTERTPLSVSTTVPSPVAASIEPGTDLTVAGQEVGTVTEVAVLNETDGGTVLHLGLELQTVRLGSQRYVGTRPVAVGTPLHISSAELDVTGRVTRVGSTEPPRPVSERNAVSPSTGD